MGTCIICKQKTSIYYVQIVLFVNNEGGNPIILLINVRGINAFLLIVALEDLKKNPISL